MNPSIYDYRDYEFAVAERARRRRRAEIIEAVVGTPFLVTALIVFILI